MWEVLIDFFKTSGFAELFSLDTELFGVMVPGRLIMIVIACLFIYLGVKKDYEPYLLIPIAFGMLLVNLPLAGLMDGPLGTQPGGLLYYLYQGTAMGIYPPLIFLCIGASTDFGPLIANPRSLLLGAAAQIGIFITFIGAIALGFTGPEAASIGIIGGADGPTALFLTSRLAPFCWDRSPLRPTHTWRWYRSFNRPS
jgi:Na+-transporting methylmalonyl-CoA/oxaloacetate decarboxylase beta subunit